MKRSIDVEIGEGLFANEPVPVEIEFADHTAIFYMTAMTSDSVVELAKDGVKLDEVSLKKMNESQTVSNSKKLLGKFLHGWEGFKAGGQDIPYSEAARDKLATTEMLGELLRLARELSVTKREGEEKN